MPAVLSLVLRASLCVIVMITINGRGFAHAAPYQDIQIQGRAQQNNIWEIKVVSVRYGAGFASGERSRVQAVVSFKNISPLPVPAMQIGGYRFTLDGPYPHSGADFNALGLVRPNQTVSVTVTFDNVTSRDQERVRELVVTELRDNPIGFHFPIPGATALAPPPTPTSTQTPTPSGTPYVMGGYATVGPWQVRATKVEPRAEGLTVTLALRNPNQTTQTFTQQELTASLSLADGSRAENLEPDSALKGTVEPHEVAPNGEDSTTLFFQIRNPLLRQRASTMNVAIVRRPLNIPVGMGQLYLPAAEPEPRPLTDFRRLNSNWSVRLDQVRPAVANSNQTLVWATVRNEWGANVTVRDAFEGVFSSSDGEEKAAAMAGTDGQNVFENSSDNRAEAATVLRPGEMASFTFFHTSANPDFRANRLRVFPKSPLGTSTHEVIFDLPAATGRGQGKTDQPTDQSQEPASTDPTPPPYAGPPPVEGDVRIFAPVVVSGDLSLQVAGLSHRDGTTAGQGETRVYADLVNQSRSPVRLAAGQVRAELVGSGGKTAPAGVDVYVNSLKQGWGDDFAIGAGQTVRLMARYALTSEAQGAVAGWSVSAGDRAFEFRLPPRDTYFRTQSAIYVDPVDPAPTPASETAMRVLEGTYSVQNVGELTLRYDGGLLKGETRLRAGQPVLDQLILTMPEAGKLRGTMQRADNPPGSVWQNLDLTVSADGARLQGEASRVHPPQNSPRPFTAVRTSAPAPASAPTPPPASTPAPSADLSRFAGTFTTSRGTTLTLTPEGGRLVGRATGENNAGAEALRLDPADGGVLTGSWRETTNNGVELGQARLTFEGSDRFSGQVTMMTGGAPFAYEGQRAGGSAATGSPAPAAASPTGVTTRIGAYDVVFVSAQKGADGDWESTWSLTNRSQTATRVNLNDLAVTMRSADGQSSTASGPYHYAGETGRRVRSSGFEIAPGEETRIRFWHSRSARMTPATYSFRVGPVDTPIGGAAAASTTSSDGFQKTSWLEMKVDRVTRAANGSVEVTMTARHADGVRRGVQHDPQLFTLVGADGSEYRNDGNYYGASGAERLNETLYLLGGSRGTVTYVFRNVPARVAPTRLILRQGGQQTASFELPR